MEPRDNNTARTPPENSGQNTTTQRQERRPPRISNLMYEPDRAETVRNFANNFGASSKTFWDRLSVRKTPRMEHSPQDFDKGPMFLTTHFLEINNPTYGQMPTVIDTSGNYRRRRFLNYQPQEGPLWKAQDKLFKLSKRCIHLLLKVPDWMSQGETYIGL